MLRQSTVAAEQVRHELGFEDDLDGEEDERNELEHNFDVVDDDDDDDGDDDDDDGTVGNESEAGAAQYLRCYACQAVSPYNGTVNSPPLCGICSSDFVEIVSSQQIREERQAAAVQQRLERAQRTSMLHATRDERNLASRREIQYQLLRELFLSSSVAVDGAARTAGATLGGGAASARSRALNRSAAALQGPRAQGLDVAAAAAAGAAGADGGGDDDREVHANIICDGCQMHPIVG